MKLFKIGNDLFSLNYRDRKAIMIDGIAELFTVARSIEIPMEEMEWALIELVKNEHNCAEFGALNNFTITTKV